MTTLLAFTLFLIYFSRSYAFSFPSSPLQARRNVMNGLRMEYVPDGLTKSQWEALKRKEEEDIKKKSLGAIGTTKFKSRSFEAWHKAGAKHLFSVNPNMAKYQERPYMQRKDGDWEGKDLKNLGLQGAGQGVARQRIRVDDLYDDLSTKGKLNSVSIFGGANLPWTIKQANELKTFNPEGKQGARGIAGKKLSDEELERLKKSLVKPIVSKSTANESAKKKFGFF